MVGFGCIFPVFAWLYVECPWNWNDILTLLSDNPWSLLAPGFWCITLLTTLSMQFGAISFQEPEPPEEVQSRSERRRNARAHQRFTKFNANHGTNRSIRTCGLRKQYPLHLRSRGHYVGAHAPTTETRHHWDVGARLREQSIALDRKRSRYSHHRGHPSGEGRSPVTAAAQHSVYPRHDPGPPRAPTRRRRRARQHRGQRPQYQPVMATGRKDGDLGNLTWTPKQRNAFSRIINHALMARVDCNFSPAILRMALQAPIKFRSSLPGASTFSVMWDSGASMSISYVKKDFVGPILPVGCLMRLKGIAKGLKIEGQGTVQWAFQDEAGQLRIVKVPAFYVPGASVRLLSTSSLLQTYPEETITLDPHAARLSGIASNPLRGPVMATINPQNNIPTATAYRYEDIHIGVAALNSTISSVSVNNMNLSEAEKELLRWHYKLGHMGFRKIQALMRSGVLAHSQAQRSLHTACAKLTLYPKCTACQYGKQRRRPAPGKTSHLVRDRAGILRKENLVPGQRVSCDHFICSTKGRLFGSRGKTADKDMFTGGAIFVDHATSYVEVEFQKHLNSHETLAAKHNFEAKCHDHGVTVQGYLTDNGSSFTSRAFSERLSVFKQVIQFAGVGAHHHNGISERAIQNIMSIARTMMLHAAIHWPDVADASLWPMAVQHAVFLYNHVPNENTGLSPIDLFTRSRWQQSKFHDLHVWGCPIYVLDKKIQDGNKLPRWKPRSTRQINMGLSSKHASTVPLVLNPNSGAITSQFHVVFDDWFATIATETSALPDFNSDEWMRLFGDSTFQYIFDEDDRILAGDPTDVARAYKQRDIVQSAMQNVEPTLPLPVTAPPAVTSVDLSTPASIESTQPQPAQPPQQPVQPPALNPDSAEREEWDLPPLVPRSSIQREKETPIRQALNPTQTPAPRTTPQVSTPRPQPTPAPQQSAPRRSTRLTDSPSSTPSTTVATQPSRRPSRQRGWSTPRLGYDGTQGGGYLSALQPDFLTVDIDGIDTPSSVVIDKETVAFHLSILARESSNDNYFAALRAAVADPDTLSWDGAMGEPDLRDQWIEAAAKEIKALEEKETWDEVPISDAKTRILPGLWVFRRKRTPDGTIKKLKARYTCRGDLQEGDFDTYAAVVAWSTIRMILVVSLMLGWHTLAIDFSSAFVQAKLDTPVWIHLPRGFQSSKTGKTCLRLKRSLYGLSIAPKKWMEHLHSALIDMGFKQSSFDQCLFYKDGVLIGTYVDDCCCAFKEKKLSDIFVNDLRKRGFELTVEGSLEEFLGIKLVRDENGTFNLTQQGLIDKIIKTTELEDCNQNSVPAVPRTLGIDPEGEPMSQTWSYPSVVGMLLYLSTNTRPEIQFAVSQVARFNHSPKQSHAVAIKTIVRYLKGTRDKGMIISPNGSFDLDLYVDADFAGLYKSDPDASPTAAKSRMGYVIMLSGCPLIWQSKLLQEVCLSTTEAEYSALSHALRSLISIRRLLRELVSNLNITGSKDVPTIRARAFEDNASTLQLAVSHRITNRTRYFLVKWHWFWEHVKAAVNPLTIVKIDTKLQIADIFTKGTSKEIFERLRKMLNGW